MRTLARILPTLLVLAIGVTVLSCAKEDDDDEPRLKRIRLFSIDSDIDSIHEINPANGKVVNTFVAPGGQIIGGNCGLAYDSVTGKLFFHDPGVGATFWVIDPDDPDPLGTAIALQTPAQGGVIYSGLAHDGTFLLALDAANGNIDFLSPNSGDPLRTETYGEAIAGGIDATQGRLYSAGQNVAGDEVIFELNFRGDVLVELFANIPGIQPQGLGLARGILFIADMGNLKIWVVDMTTGNVIDDFSIQGATSVCGLAAGKK